MKRKLIALLAVATLAFSLTACGSDATTEENNGQTTETPAAAVVEEFAAEYEMTGTTSSGAPKNDTFIFNGTTEDNIITELEFDVIRNKGLADEYSKKGLMNYLMNISDATVEATETGFKLTTLTSYGYDPAYGEGGSAQFMVGASIENLTAETTFGELTLVNDAAVMMGQEDTSLTMDKALLAFQYVATEAGIETLTEDTLVVDLLAPHGLFVDGTITEGSQRTSYAGFNGGRSYGEQLDAITAHIIENKMTLEEVYEMFKTVNQADSAVEDRDVVSGATITFVGDFQRMVYVAMHGELFQGVVTHTEAEGNTTVEVVTQGYGGEVETHITFDAEGKITAITVRDSNETDGIGAVLTAENSDYINALIAGQDAVADVEVVSGATVTANALKDAVNYAVEYYNGL